MVKAGAIELILSKITHPPPVKKESELTYADMVSFSRPFLGRAVCDFELGLVAGALEKITGKRIAAKEVKCNGLGDGICWLDYKIT